MQKKIVQSYFMMPLIKLSSKIPPYHDQFMKLKGQENVRLNLDPFLKMEVSLVFDVLSRSFLKN